MTLAEMNRAKHKAEKDFEREHGYTTSETLKAVDGCPVSVYTFRQDTVSVGVGCNKTDENSDHANPIVVRMWGIGGQGQGEAKVVFRDGMTTYFEMSTFGGWEHYEMVNAIKFILDVLENGEPTNDYSYRFDTTHVDSTTENKVD